MVVDVAKGVSRREPHVGVAFGQPPGVEVRVQTQTLNDVLKSERPDVDERRSNLVKMQGEFTQRLRRLERMLLSALNESRGNILDDENVIQTLETLKTRARHV